MLHDLPGRFALLAAAAGWLAAGCSQTHEVALPPATPADCANIGDGSPRSYPPQTVLLYNARRIADGRLPEADRLASLAVVEQFGQPPDEVRQCLALVAADPATPDTLQFRLSLMLPAEAPPPTKLVLGAPGPQGPRDGG